LLPAFPDEKQLLWLSAYGVYMVKKNGDRKKQIAGLVLWFVSFLKKLEQNSPPTHTFLLFLTRRSGIATTTKNSNQCI